MDEWGNWTVTIRACTDVLHEPDDADVWTCTQCGNDDTILLAESEFLIIVAMVDKERHDRLMQTEHVDFVKDDLLAPYSMVQSWITICEDAAGIRYEADIKVCSSGRENTFGAKQSCFKMAARSRVLK